MKIEKIDWSVKYSVANKELDEDHKKIIVLINKIVEYHNSNFYSDNITDICYELISYSYKHNEFEETILESLGYPDLKSLKE